MPGLFGILETARRALAAQSIGMNVTSHNIANAATRGYSRQRAELAATLPLRNAKGMFIGTGVDVLSVSRLRDRFVDTQYRGAYSSYGSAAMRHSVLSEIETGLGEPGESGLQATMTKFFNSFQELSTHPEDGGGRNAVLAQANNLVSTFNRLSTNFTSQQSNLAESAAIKVTQINSLTERIAQLNQQIGNSRGAGNDPSDLMDQRDMVIDELSGLTNITASQDTTGIMLVSIGGMLVAGNGISTALKSTNAGGQLQISTTNGQDVSVTGGELGGLLDMHNTTIPANIAQLDALANAVITRVNAVHSAGYGLGTPPPTGMNFFTGTSAATIGIDSQISSNISNIAASGTGAPGDNTNALALFGIMEERLMDGGTTTFTQYYTRFVSNVGSSVKSALGALTGTELVVGQLDAKRESVSGVSLDEEMTNMIKFQRSFEAASRVVNTANELFDTILNMV